MKISIINGSPRKNGATGKILRTIADRIKNNSHFEIRYYDLSDFEFKGIIEKYRKKGIYSSIAGIKINNQTDQTLS